MDMVDKSITELVEELLKYLNKNIDVNIYIKKVTKVYQVSFNEDTLELMIKYKATDNEYPSGGKGLFHIFIKKDFIKICDKYGEKEYQLNDEQYLQVVIISQFIYISTKHLYFE